MTMLSYVIVASVYIWAFIIGRITMKPMNRLRIKNRRRQDSVLAEKSMIRLPSIIVEVLFWKKDNEVTFHALFYQIALFVLFFRCIYIYIYGGGSIESMNRKVIDPIIIIIAINLVIGWLIMKADDNRNNV